MKAISIFGQEEKLLEVSIPRLKITVTNRGMQGSHFCKCRIGKYGEKMGKRWKSFDIPFANEDSFGIHADSTGLICSHIKMVPVDQYGFFGITMSWTIVLTTCISVFCQGFFGVPKFAFAIGFACGVVIGPIIYLLLIKMMHRWEVEVSNGVKENEEASCILFRVPVKSLEDEIKIRDFISEFDKIQAELRLDYDNKKTTTCD